MDNKIKKLYVELGALDKKRRIVLEQIKASPEYIHDYFYLVTESMKGKFYKHIKTNSIGILDKIIIPDINVIKKIKGPEIECQCYFILYDINNVKSTEQIKFNTNISIKKEIEKQILANNFEIISNEEYSQQKKIIEKNSLLIIKKLRLEEELKAIKEKEKEISKKLAVLNA